MPPKFNPDEEKLIVVRCIGGEPPSTATLGPKLGPHGLQAKKVGEDLMKSTKDWKGLKITCHLIVKNRQAEVKVAPSVATMVIKALKEPPRDRKKVKNIKHSGSIPFKEILAIAKTIREKSLARTMSGTVREVIGTAMSTGCMIDGENPRMTLLKIAKGEIKVPEK